MAWRSGVRWIGFVRSRDRDCFGALRGLRQGGWIRELVLAATIAGRSDNDDPALLCVANGKTRGLVERRAAKTEVDHIGPVGDSPRDAACHVRIEPPPGRVEDLDRQNLGLRGGASDAGEVVVN